MPNESQSCFCHITNFGTMCGFIHKRSNRFSNSIDPRHQLVTMVFSLQVALGDFGILTTSVRKELIVIFMLMPYRHAQYCVYRYYTKTKTWMFYFSMNLTIPFINTSIHQLQNLTNEIT